MCVADVMIYLQFFVFMPLNIQYILKQHIIYASSDQW